MELKLTAAQLTELAYKLEILATEPDMLESYGITEDQATSLENMVERARTSKVSLYDLPEKAVQVLIGEMDNAAEVAHSWWKSGDTKTAYNNFTDGVKRLQAYADHHGYDTNL